MKRDKYFHYSSKGLHQCKLEHGLTVIQEQDRLASVIKCTNCAHDAYLNTQILAKDILDDKKIDEIIEKLKTKEGRERISRNLLRTADMLHEVRDLAHFGYGHMISARSFWRDYFDTQREIEELKAEMARKYGE
jgi:hypothetical protein